MAYASQSPERSMLDEYRAVLDRCTYEVACQNRCDLDNTKPCSCLRHIVHVDALMRWWHEKIPGGSGQTKLKQLLAELPHSEHRTFPFHFRNHQEVFNGDHSCLTVLSILLALDRAVLIDIFYDSGMTDKHLDIVREVTNRHLRESLRTFEPREVDVILKDFHRERWAYCPLKLTIDMDHHLEGSKVIPPFCHKIPFPNKGASASVYLVAVQKDLIADEGLKRAINDSIYKDERYGECYQMVLKTYCAASKKLFDLEKAAFEGLAHHNGVPIVRYLGCYTHDYGDGANRDRTYNLLLEHGECDLYQAWADETNVPPVRAEEIIRMWKSYLDVAKAIRHVHNLELPRNGSNPPILYNGWHADIKPDNILVIRGHLKLADFGLSRFTRVARQTGGGVPTELIEGFTISYGAPEVTHIQQPNGTMSGVTQTIDTWSFGCVLSVAATWVVLGFQGVRAFEQLRQLATRDKTDRFHDGVDVIPQIRRWHNFLRGHLRPSDTATALVLELVENNMLQKEAPNRLKSGELCKRLEDIIGRASAKVDELEEHSRLTDPSVLEALLAIEKLAQVEKNNKRTTSTPLAVDVNALNPVQRATMQIEKGDLSKSRPLGQTPYRREILEQQLRVNNLVQHDHENFTGASYHGDLTDSPTPFLPLGDILAVPPLNLAKQKPIHPNRREVTFEADATTTTETVPTSSRSPNAETKSILVPQAKHNLNVAGSDQQDHSGFPQRVFHPIERIPESHSESTTASHGHTNFPSGPSSTASHPAFSIETERNPHGSTRITYPAPSIVSPSTPVEFGNNETIGLYHQHTPYDAIPSSSGASPTINDMGRRWPEDGTHRLAESQQLHDKSQWHVEGPAHSAPTQPARPSSYRGYSSNHQPSASGISELAAPMTVPGRYQFQSDRDEKQPMTASESLRRDPLPQSVDGLPYDICHVRTELDHHTPKGKRALVKSLFGKEERRTDQVLAETYGYRREIVFVIDNSATMLEHWPIVVFVAETLVMKAAGLDKDGVDLIFTVDGREHNKSRLKADAGRKAFRTALNRAEPENTNRKDCQTDMHKTLNDIHQKWKTNGEPPTTLLILTDGKWGNTMDNLVDNTIIDIAGTLSKKKAGLRPFGIQFIRFGDECVDKLERLDNKLCNDRGLKDIVDHCSWRSTVGKMLKGSISGWEDDNDPEEIPITFDYRALVALFQDFNNDVLQDRVTPTSSLSPPSVLRRSISRSSSRNSIIDAQKRKHDSAPPPQSGPASWQHGHYRTPMSG